LTARRKIESIRTAQLKKLVTSKEKRNQKYKIGKTTKPNMVTGLEMNTAISFFL